MYIALVLRHFSIVISNGAKVLEHFLLVLPRLSYTCEVGVL